MCRHGLFTPEGGDALPEFRIGLAPVALEHWFEGGECEPAARKDSLLKAQPALTWGEAEGSRTAQTEIVAMISDWLGTPVNVGDRAPLLAAARHISDDLCLMERRGGAWTLSAACLCAPSFFSAKEAVGLALSELHAPVPGFESALLPRVVRIFDNLQPDQILERRNWTLVNDAEPFQPDPAPFRARLAGRSLETIAASLQIRRERQTLRRAPQSGAILFTIRVWTERLDHVLGALERRQGFANAWDRVMSKEGAPFRTYKRLDLYDAAVRYRLSGLKGP